MNQTFPRYVVFAESYRTINIFILHLFQPNLITVLKIISLIPFSGYFCPKEICPKTSGSVMLNPTWNPNSMLSFRKKYNGPILDQWWTRKLPKRLKDGQKDSGIDIQEDLKTQIRRTLLVTAKDPRMTPAWSNLNCENAQLPSWQIKQYFFVVKIQQTFCEITAWSCSTSWSLTLKKKVI